MDKSTTRTEIPSQYETIKVVCSTDSMNASSLVYLDYFNFFRPNKKIEAEADLRIDASESDHLSVIYLGIDGVSLSNFQRFLPNTHSFLMAELSAIEFVGLNKVGRGTLENVMPVMTGCSVTVNEQTVFPKNQDCPPIWERFSTKGYLSLISEEQDWHIIYQNFRRSRWTGGSRQHNTTYDNFSFIKGIQSNCPYVLSRSGCFRHQFAPNIIKDRIIEVARKYSSRLYYHQAWTQMITHDYMSSAKYLDTPILETIQTLKRDQLLNNTVLIINSDHGLISSKYSRTVEGLIEARQPFLYMVFPEWFKTKYNTAYQNLMKNSKKLITPFDLYQTLKSLSSLKGIGNREVELTEIAERNSEFGMSLFLDIPNRTCREAHIPEGYCICTVWDQLNNPENDYNVTKAVSFALDHVNSELLLTTQKKCMKLDLWKILNGRTSKDSKTGDILYEVRFQTIPGKGIFSALLKTNAETGQTFQLIGEVERQNIYGDQSHCLNTKTGWARSACYCKSKKTNTKIKANRNTILQVLFNSM